MSISKQKKLRLLTQFSVKVLILGSKRLENLNISFKDENAIRRFNEVDFENQLQTVKSLNLKMLSITCSARRQPMPYKSFLSLVKSLPVLTGNQL